MTQHKQAIGIYIIGVASLVFLVIVILFLSELFQPLTQQSSSAGNTAVAGQNSGSLDPLVTLSPDNPAAGTPRMIASDPVRGAENPTVTIIEFGDFQCGDCAAMSTVMVEVLKKYPQDVRHVWKDFPLTTEHPQATEAAQAARCAQEQNKFWEYHDYLLTNQTALPLLPWNDLAVSAGLNTDLFQTCMEKGTRDYLVTQSTAAARTLGLTQTPSYYINDQFIAGPVSAEEMTRIVEEEINAQKNSF